MWLLDAVYTRLQDALITVLKYGKLPQHVAFIMDGNRRYARKLGMHPGQGHIKGFDKLHQILELCLKLEIKAVTVYAFSIENFKRSAEEVDILMQLAKEKLLLWCEENALAKQYGVRINIIGDLTLLPADVRDIVDRVMSMTAHNTQATLNICFPYTARDEMRQAIMHVCHDVQEGTLEPHEITTQLLGSHLLTANSPPLDLLIRTSGEARLSDFLLWQVSSTACPIYFIDALWPELSSLQLLQLLLSYQLH